MAPIYIDSWLLGLPRDSSRVDEYLSRLIDFSDNKYESFLPLEISAKTPEILQKDNVFPLSAEIPPFMWAAKSDVFRLVARILDRIPKIEDRGIKEALIDNSLIEPELTASTRGHHEHVQELSATCLIWMEAEEKVKVTPCLLSEITKEPRFNFIFDLYDIETVKKIDFRLGKYAGSISTSSSIEAFLLALDATDLGTQGKLQEAVKVWLLKNGYSGLLPAGHGWNFGSGFAESVVARNIPSNRARMNSLLRTMAGIITSTDNRAVHWLRADRGPNSAQRKRLRDGALAWRADIDDELHLHYWVCSTGIEFANTVQHNDFSIIE